jgi:hypothetical protein
MILTDYYKADKLSESKSRFDITASNGKYDFFEQLLKNQRGFNIGGLSFNLVPRPNYWGGSKTDLALTKGSHNLTSLKQPNPLLPYAYGDINGTNDGCLIVFNCNFREVGITTIEIIIGRGLKNHIISLWNLFTDGDLDLEIELLKRQSDALPMPNLS